MIGQSKTLVLVLRHSIENHAIPQNTLTCGDSDPFGQHERITSSGDKNVLLPKTETNVKRSIDAIQRPPKNGPFSLGLKLKNEIKIC